MSDKKRHINPRYNRHAGREYSIQECITKLATDRQVLSYLISKAEAIDRDSISFINQVIDGTLPDKTARRIAVSGSPGVGKSTLLNSFGKHLVEQGNSIAILPIDPTSYHSHGSILGDKTRMEDLVGEASVYIKPMASSLALGGVAPATHNAILLCERAGFDYIFVETVGVGQSEYEVRHLVDLFLLVLQPGGGDELQGIKRGIMEMADLMVVTKADGDLLDAAKQSIKNHKQAQSIMMSKTSGWTPQVVPYSSVTHEHAAGLGDRIDNYFDYMKEDGRLETMRRQQSSKYFMEMVDRSIIRFFKEKSATEGFIKELAEKVAKGEIMPQKGVEIFKDKLNEGND